MGQPAWHPYAPDQRFGRQGMIDEERAEAALDELQRASGEPPRAANKAVPPLGAETDGAGHRDTTGSAGAAADHEPALGGRAAQGPVAVTQDVSAAPLRGDGPLEVVPGRGHVITVRGEIDASTAPQLRDRLEEVAPAARRRVVLDVKDVDFRDWTGLGVLVGGRKRLRQAGGDLVLRSPKPATTKLLEISGLQGIFTIE